LIHQAIFENHGSDGSDHGSIRRHRHCPTSHLSKIGIIHAGRQMGRLFQPPTQPVAAPRWTELLPALSFALLLVVATVNLSSVSGQLKQIAIQAADAQAYIIHTQPAWHSYQPEYFSSQ